MFDLDRQTHSVKVREAVSCVHHKSLVCRHPTHRIRMQMQSTVCVLLTLPYLFSAQKFMPADSLARRQKCMGTLPLLLKPSPRHDQVHLAVC